MIDLEKFRQVPANRYALWREGCQVLKVAVA